MLPVEGDTVSIKIARKYEKENNQADTITHVDVKQKRESIEMEINDKISRLENINLIAYGMQTYFVMVMGSCFILSMHLFLEIKTGDIKEVTISASNFLDYYKAVLIVANALMSIFIIVKMFITEIEGCKYKELLLFTLGVVISNILVMVFPPFILVILPLPWHLLSIWIRHSLNKI